MEGCDEWTDAVCTISDHSLITISTKKQKEGNVEKTKRKEAWRRTPSDGCTEIDEQWTKVNYDCEFMPLHTHWSRWKECFKEQAARWVGRTKIRVKKHWKHEWDEE